MSIEPPFPSDLMPSNPGTGSLHLSLAILALGFSVFLFAQIRSVAEQTELLRWQIGNAETQDKSLKSTEKQLHDLSIQREPLVKQSAEIQAKYQSLLNDVLELAKDDKDAQAVVENWKIQRSTPSSPATAGGTPAPAAAPAPAGK
jgi:hypothetical protein